MYLMMDDGEESETFDDDGGDGNGKSGENCEKNGPSRIRRKDHRVHLRHSSEVLVAVRFRFLIHPQILSEHYHPSLQHHNLSFLFGPDPSHYSSYSHHAFYRLFYLHLY